MSQFRQPSLAAERSLVVRSLALRLPSGHRIEEHKHAWCQIVYAARGVMSVEVYAKQWIVPPLRCLWVPAGVPHTIETISEAWMRTVYLRPELAVEVSPCIRVMDVSPLLRELLLEVVRLGMLDEADDLHRNLASILIALLVQAPELELGLPLPHDPRARRVADRVRSNPGENASLAELTRGAGASPRTVERLFLKETGLSFGRWRQQVRLQLAVRHLAEGMPVTNVAFQCGYDSVSAFVTMFRRSFGVTPGQYIRVAQAGI